MSQRFVTKSNGLMLLSLGALALFLTAYLLVNSNLNPQAKARGIGQTTGVLVSDLNYLFPCNKTAMAAYVLRNPVLSDECMPVMASKSLLSPFEGREVTLTGINVKGVFYARDIKLGF